MNLISTLFGERPERTQRSFFCLFSSSLTLYLDKVQTVLNDDCFASGIRNSTAKRTIFCFINGVLFSHHGDALVSRDKAERPLIPEHHHGILHTDIE
jgi:hypothetical protein